MLVTLFETTVMGDILVEVPAQQHATVRLGAEGEILEWSAGGVKHDGRGRVVERTRTLERDEEICGIPCAAGRAVFDADGRLTEAKLARDHAFGALVVPAGSRVWLGPHAELRGASLSAPTVIEGRTLDAGTIVRFDEKGALSPWQATVTVGPWTRIG